VQSSPPISNQVIEYIIFTPYLLYQPLAVKKSQC
jgi:hypothetical protein